MEKTFDHNGDGVIDVSEIEAQFGKGVSPDALAGEYQELAKQNYASFLQAASGGSITYQQAHDVIQGMSEAACEVFNWQLGRLEVPSSALAQSEAAVEEAPVEAPAE